MFRPNFEEQSGDPDNQENRVEQPESEGDQVAEEIESMAQVTQEIDYETQLRVLKTEAEKLDNQSMVNQVKRLQQILEDDPEEDVSDDVDTLKNQLKAVRKELENEG